MSLNISELRGCRGHILAVGIHSKIFQSILDYDFLLGKTAPSLRAIVYSGKKYEKLFFGNKEVLIPVYESGDLIPQDVAIEINYFINVSSVRRAVISTEQIFSNMVSLRGCSVFAEDVPEKLSLDLYRFAREHNKFIIGPASIGLLIPGVLKLGPIGGVDYRQFLSSKLFFKGSFAVMSASGGMTNEIMKVVTAAGHGLSFALSFGGDRFPVLTPGEAFLAAENDPETTHIAYFGELGGEDEYVLAKLLHERKVTKKVICHIVGTVAEISDNPIQFGHAKALAGKKAETARAKRDALRIAGAQVSETFEEFVNLINSTQSAEPMPVGTSDFESRSLVIKERKQKLFTSSISRDIGGEVELLGEDQIELANNNSFTELTLALLLGKKVKSPEFIKLVEFIFKILLDNGPYVSGAVNTIIASRAGKDLVSSLAAGLLTIGPRFGGAVNQAALNWMYGVKSEKSAFDFVEEYASQKKYILGIGHKKYRADLPDPRVTELLKFAESLEFKKYLTFARSVEQITIAKKGTLILNVDGVMAALLLDFLSEKEGYSESALEELVEVEFFNAFFVLPRTIGLAAHFFDQKRLDEGLFRLGNDDVSFVGIS